MIWLDTAPGAIPWRHLRLCVDWQVISCYSASRHQQSGFWAINWWLQGVKILRSYINAARVIFGSFSHLRGYWVSVLSSPALNCRLRRQWEGDGERKQPFPIQTCERKQQCRAAAAKSTFIDKNKQRKDGLNSLGGHGEDRRLFAHSGSALCCAANRGFGRVWITVAMNSGQDCVRNTCLQLILLKTV